MLDRKFFESAQAAPADRAVKATVPEFKDDCFVARLTAYERDEMETLWRELRVAGTPGGFRAVAMAVCLCDADGKRFATEIDDVREFAARLNKIDASAASRIFDRLSRVNRLTAADVKELEGN